MSVDESGANVHIGTAGDADFNAAAGGGLAVAWAQVCGLGAVVDDLREWETRQLGSRQLGSSKDGSGAEGKDEAHEAREVDSSGDHCCGNVVFVVDLEERKLEIVD